jgi:hypothetical protein
MSEAVISAIKAVFPTNFVTVSKGTLGKALFAKLFVAADNTQFINGISQNDPLSVTIMIEDNTVEFTQKHISINPENKFYVYGSHRFNVRKFKFKDETDLVKKLKNAFSKIKEEGKVLVDNNQFTVYDSYPEIKARIEQSFS